MNPLVPASYVRRNAPVANFIGRTLMRLSGWRIEGSLPDVPKVIIAVAPHTSNWDFVVGVMTLFVLDVKLSFLGKHTLFKGWFGKWMRSIGGIPVDRSQPNGVVGETVAAFNRADKLVLAVAPEGTRQLDRGFKTGFLHMAYGAKVPVLLAYFDFSRKVIGFGPLIQPSGDAEKDLQEILAYFQPIRGKYRKVWQESFVAK
ncbi:MAG: lysophospholipid acyltransferase family protein [Betaproteobacteria bacterium]|nr:lysophospholipid acyltransferase family protein [Betaproteobacteria bacterium]